MPFLAPTMLWGMLAAGVPIALHFFFRSRYRRVPWAAMQFLLTSIEQTSRRLRFQELFLLFFRVTLLVLLALALARPSSSSSSGGPGEAVDAVLLVDASTSMDARDGGRTRLERAQEAARTVLDGLPPLSSVHIVVAADRVLNEGPRTPTDLVAARRLIDELTLSQLGTDLVPGMQAALDWLRQAGAPNKELYIFSDMQKLGWENQSASLREALQEAQRLATVALVRCGRSAVANVSVIDIVPQAGIPHTQERISFAVLVRNSGAEAVRNLTVTLAVDSASEPETAPLPELGPGETRPVPLTVRFDQPGWRVLSATVRPDDLEADNRFDQVVQVRERVRVLVVDGSPDNRQPEKSASFYLLHGLVPVSDAARDRYPIQPRLVRAAQATPADLAEQDVCILVDVPLEVDRTGTQPVRRDFLDRLGPFVRRGHGLVVFAGPHAEPTAYNRLLRSELGLLPAPLAATRSPTSRVLHPDRATAGGSFVLLRNDDYFRPLNRVEVRDMQAIEPGTAEPGRTDDYEVLLRYDDGRPAVLTRSVGGGQVVLVTTTADSRWTDWPLASGMFVPFVDLCLNQALRGGAQAHNRVAGSRLHWQPSETTLGESFVLLDPSGAETRLPSPERVEDRALVTTPSLPRAGVYRIVAATAPRATAEPFAIVPDPRETENLATFTDAEIDARLGFTPIHLAATDRLSDAIAATRQHQDWTVWLLLIVMATALGETALAWWCGRAW